MQRKKSYTRFKRFFLNDHLHRVIHTNRARNTITAYDFIDHKLKTYPYSEVENNKVNAFKLSEAGEILNRKKARILMYMRDGLGRTPQREYHLKTKKPGTYFLSEKDIMDVRDFMAGVHRGRPRQDSRITNSSVPTREEVRSMIQSGRILYVKENDEFVPIWKARDW
jgi:hypothetical protein